jgi:hypothetical protein
MQTVVQAVHARPARCRRATLPFVFLLFWCSCIPVLIHDGVEPSWNSILDVASYSVRIAEKDMARVPDILGDVSQEEVTRMQANLAKVWRR